MTWRLTRSLIPLQAGVAMLALAALALWPPARGAILLVPLGQGGVNATAKVALAGGAALVGLGPFPGSLVVQGDRARIARHAGRWTMVILAAPPAGCGAVGDIVTQA